MARGTTGEIAARIYELTGHSSTTLPETLVLEAINTAIEEMQLAADWQPQDQSWELTYQPDQDGATLPEGVIGLYDVYRRDPAQPDPSRQLVPLGELTRHQWLERANAPDASRTFPRPSITGTFYYVWDGKLYVVPQPSAALAIVVDYRGFIRPLTNVTGGTIATSTVPSTESENYFTRAYQRTVTWLALPIVWMALGEDEFMVAAEARGQRLLQRAIKHEAVLKSSGPPKVRGT